MCIMTVTIITTISSYTCVYISLSLYIYIYIYIYITCNIS